MGSKSVSNASSGGSSSELEPSGVAD
jgi:hypothetical protein